MPLPFCLRIMDLWVVCPGGELQRTRTGFSAETSSRRLRTTVVAFREHVLVVNPGVGLLQARAQRNVRLPAQILPDQLLSLLRPFTPLGASRS